jgi:peptide/nickel transport system permease protein
MFTRLLYAARNAIARGFVITIFHFIVGIICDFTAATLKGWTDQVLSGTVDIMMAFPNLIFALMILSMVGTSIVALSLVIAGVPPAAGGDHGH